MHWECRTKNSLSKKPARSGHVKGQSGVNPGACMTVSFKSRSEDFLELLRGIGGEVEDAPTGKKVL